MAVCTVVSAKSCNPAGNTVRQSDGDDVCNVDGSNGSACDLPVSGTFEVHDEAERDGEACVCDDDTVFRIYTFDSDRNGAFGVGMVFLSAVDHNPVLARIMVFCLYIYGRKSTSEIYAGTRRKCGCLVL